MPIRIAILSDIHGNSPALRAVLADVDRQGCQRIYFLGDIVNGADPHGCIAILREWSDGTGRELCCVRGNAEAYTLTPCLEELPGREEPENQELIRLITWFRQHLTAADIDWLESLPDVLVLDKLCLAHDSPLDRLFPARWHIPGLAEPYQEWFFHAPGIRKTLSMTALVELTGWMEANEVTHVFCGHTHEPFMIRSAGRLICNAGAVGFCLDGDPRPSWALMDGDVTIRRVAYDVDQALQMIDESSYPTLEDPAMRRAYKKMFRTGLHWRVHLKGEA